MSQSRLPVLDWPPGMSQESSCSPHQRGQDLGETKSGMHSFVPSMERIVVFLGFRAVLALEVLSRQAFYH